MRPIASVKSLVVLEDVRPAECLAARWALVRSNSTVPQHVCQQIAPLFAGVGAHRTLVRPFGGVNQLVELQ